MLLNLKSGLRLVVLSCGFVFWCLPSFGSFSWTFSEPDRSYGLLHVHTGYQMWLRDFPIIERQSLMSFCASVDVEVWSFLFVGMTFRGLTDFKTGTNSTTVSTDFEEFGPMVSVAVFSIRGFGDKSDVRLTLSGGAFVKFQTTKFVEKEIVRSSLSKRVTTWVFPLEGRVELIVLNWLSFRFFVGYALHEQAQTAYHGASLGVFLF